MFQLDLIRGESLLSLDAQSRARVLLKSYRYGSRWRDTVISTVQDTVAFQKYYLKSFLLRKHFHGAG